MAPRVPPKQSHCCNRIKVPKICGVPTASQKLALRGVYGTVSRRFQKPWCSTFNWNGEQENICHMLAWDQWFSVGITATASAPQFTCWWKKPDWFVVGFSGLLPLGAAPSELQLGCSAGRRGQPMHPAMEHPDVSGTVVDLMMGKIVPDPYAS